MRVSVVLAALAIAGCAADAVVLGLRPDVAPPSNANATPDMPPSTCRDGAQNGDESDVDCGGIRCKACATGRTCRASLDCETRECDGHCVALAGCADLTREGFADASAFPDIAACAGAWSVPGLRVPSGPTCERRAGNDGALPNGSGCGGADLCQTGFHVCLDSGDARASGLATCAALLPHPEHAFFATRASGRGGGFCSDDARAGNDLFGCSDLGYTTADCGVLSGWTDHKCKQLASTPWSCGADDDAEAQNVVKSGPANGGILCCRDR